MERRQPSCEQAAAADASQHPRVTVESPTRVVHMTALGRAGPATTWPPLARLCTGELQGELQGESRGDEGGRSARAVRARNRSEAAPSFSAAAGGGGRMHTGEGTAVAGEAD